MSAWNKQDWIKDILSKSGTDITEIRDEAENKDNRKMVYYTALPLMLQTDASSSMQLCNSNDTDTVRVSNLSNNTTLIYPENQLYTNMHMTINNVKQNINDTINISNNSVHHHQQIVPQQHHHHQQQQQPPPPPPPPQQTQQQKPQFKCDQCNMLFGSKSAHTSHIKSHAKLVQQQLSRVSTTVSVTTVAGSNGNPSDPYQCDVCKKTFAVPARLVRHYRTHTGERPFECEFCHKMFSVKENLQVHRRIHTKERPYKCEVCGRAFEHSGKLHRHMRIHTGERPHKCSVCGKTFIQSGQLVIHMRTHTGEKPYKCPVEGCGKGFTCSKQLKVHSRTHTGEKPYHCDICFRDFGYNHVLKLHRVQHYGSKCYKCTICDETFKSKKEMEAHIKGHANEIPDDDDDEADSNISSFEGEQYPIKLEKPLEIDSELNNGVSDAHKSGKLMTKLPETPRESSSEANSDGDELAYYNSMYSRYEGPLTTEVGQAASTITAAYVPHTTGGVNPALLAAVSMATSNLAAQNEEELKELRRSPVEPEPMAIDMHVASVKQERVMIQQHQQQQEQQQRTMESHSQHHSQQLQQPQQHQNAMLQNTFDYEPLAVMRQQGYFAPVPKVEEYKSSIESANEIVKRVEAALAGAEPLLTPPRSSPESPDRASSPESDSILMADRDNMSLPLRKRKLYLNDDRSNTTASKNENNTNKGESPVVRMSSVIQFAKAS